MYKQETYLILKEISVLETKDGKQYSIEVETQNNQNVFFFQKKIDLEPKLTSSCKEKVKVTTHWLREHVNRENNNYKNMYALNVEHQTS